MRTPNMNLCINYYLFFIFLVDSSSSSSPSFAYYDAANDGGNISNDSASSTTMTNICLGACETDIDGGSTKVCRFDFKVNLFAGELGYFQVDQCGDHPNPTLGIEKGVTYIFSQKDETNYYHPLGFAYYPDGAHDCVDELEPVIAPPGSNSNCDTKSDCPAPMYLKDGVYLGTYSNNDYVAPVDASDNFGLDDYEPDFFLDALTWNSAEYSVALKFDVSDFDDDIFYFCHIHQFMTGRIKFVDEEGMPLNEDNLPEIPYQYDVPSEYDKSCGTYNLESYRLPHPECPSKFICGKYGTDTPVGRFADCLDSMNCAMAVGMTSNIHMNSAIALFNHQMIPHHQNAVNMCKALMKTGDIECEDMMNEDDESCIMRRLCYGIINSQNREIQIMRGVLSSLGYKGEDDCRVQMTGKSWEGKAGASKSLPKKSSKSKKNKKNSWV